MLTKRYTPARLFAYQEGDKTVWTPVSLYTTVLDAYRARVHIIRLHNLPFEGGRPAVFVDASGHYWI